MVTSDSSSKDEYVPVIHSKATKIRLVRDIFEWILKYTISALIGFLFGYAMEKSKVYEPKAIRQQMIFQKFIMLKMFLTAFATSTLSIFLIALLFKKRYESLFQCGKDALKNKPLIALISGGILIGVGMQISGSCPGMVLVQLGAGVPFSWVTLLGSLSGALAHGLVNNKLSKDAKAESYIPKAIFEILPVNPIITRLFIIIMLALTVFLMEFFIPYTNEYVNAIPANTTNILIYKAWPPYSCGLILGSMQLVSILALGKSLGASSFYSTIAGIPFHGKYLAEKFPYLAKFRTGLQNWLALAFTIGAILGSLASCYPAGIFGKTQGAHPYDAYLGGFVMVFGARIAGGCTSGHGISGCSHQYVGSLITTASMFAGAIILAFYAYTNDFFFN